MKILIASLFFFFSTTIIAQVYIDGGKTRHRFAQMTLGLDTKISMGTSAYSYRISEQNEIVKFNLNNQYSSRLIIGGTHFWGHADFYIAIPVVNWNNSGFSEGVETGFRYFPWQIKNKKIRPFIGTAFLRNIYTQGEGADLASYKFPFTGGLAYNRGSHLFEIGAGYNFDNKDNYFISTTQQTPLNMHNYWISFGYKWMIETTLSAEKDWKSGRTQAVTDTLAKYKKLNGLTLSVGPSAAIYLKDSDYLTDLAPYAEQHTTSIFPEFGVGYYWHNPDIQVQLVYRKSKSEVEAFNFKQAAERKALTAEAYKFVGDYHGFAPFIGLALSYEQLTVNQSGSGLSSNNNFEGVKPGITVGWDIRPNRIQSFYLRTHLRYFPNMNVDMGANNTISLDQLEFNFIELVVFPGRIF